MNPTDPKNHTPTQESQEHQKNQQEEMKNQILTQVLTQQARARLNTLTLAKPEKGQAVENLLIQMTRTGQLRQKIDETELITLLERVNDQQTTKNSSVKFDRRRTRLDSDSDSDYDL